MAKKKKAPAADSAPAATEEKKPKKLEKLTDEQTARFPEFVQKWTDIGLNTDPADRPGAEAAIQKCYKIANLTPPERIVWSGSPLAAGLSMALLQELAKNDPTTGKPKFTHLLDKAAELALAQQAELAKNPEQNLFKPLMRNALADPEMTRLLAQVQQAQAAGPDATVQAKVAAGQERLADAAAGE